MSDGGYILVLWGHLSKSSRVSPSGIKNRVVTKSSVPSNSVVAWNWTFKRYSSFLINKAITVLNLVTVWLSKHFSKYFLNICWDLAGRKMFRHGLAFHPMHQFPIGIIRKAIHTKFIRCNAFCLTLSSIWLRFRKFIFWSISFKLIPVHFFR